MFLDFGPIFSEWEADFGRTYVLGDDPVKHRLRDDLERVWPAGREHFEAHPAITGAQLYAHVVGLAEAAAGSSAGAHSGHLVGEFPHETDRRRADRELHRPGQRTRCGAPTGSGRQCHWILEVHLVDRERRIGGFFEQLLTLRR